MKKVRLIIVAIFFGTVCAFSQTGTDFDHFSGSVFPEYRAYFDKTILSEKGKLQLIANESFEQMSTSQQSTIISEMLKEWKDSLILVYSPQKTQIWSRNTESKTFQIIDEMSNYIIYKPAEELNIARMQPFFVYFGGMISFNEQKILNLAINTRAGFYLLYNRWDMALTMSAGRTGNVEMTSTGYSSIGVASRVHFPIKRTGVVPHIGLELAYSSFGQTSQGFVPSVVFGLSWFVGVGSVNIGINVGDNISGAGGFTVFPGAKHVR